MTQVLKSRKGVTLVELLAVIVILGIIAAIAVPTIGGLITRQQTNADNATFTAIEEQAVLYAIDDNDGKFTLLDIVNDGFDLKANVVSYDGSTAIDEADFDDIVITVTGSTVVFTHLLTTSPLYINGTQVVTLMAIGTAPTP